MVGELRVDTFCWAESHPDHFHVFPGVVWLVAVIVGSPMWHVQRLEVRWGPGLIIGVTEMSSHALSVLSCFLPAKRMAESLHDLGYFTGGFSRGIELPERFPSVVPGAILVFCW